MNNYKIVYPDELSHFGVKGMKWGVRKDKIKDRLEKTYYTPKSKKDAHLYSLKSAATSSGIQASMSVGIKYLMAKKGMDYMPSNKTLLISAGATFVYNFLANEVSYARKGKIRKI